MTLTEAIAVITGASGGLGRAVVDALRSKGVQVAAPTHAEVDIRRDDQVDAYMNRIVRQHGCIDILVNCAGWAEPLGLLEDVTDDMYNRCMDTNVKGVFHCLHAVLPVMKQRGSGIIITIGSRAGTHAHPRLPIYSASKFAVRGLTQSVARACIQEGNNIQAITLSPAGIDTGMRAALFGKEDSARQQKPESVAEIIVQYLQGEVDIPNGADVHITHGSIQGIFPMETK